MLSSRWQSSSSARRSYAHPVHSTTLQAAGKAAVSIVNNGVLDASAGIQKSLTGRLSVYAISDLHTDHKENLAWVQHQLGPSSSSSSHGPQEHDTSVLIVAGDISDDLGLLRTTLQALTTKFSIVAFVAGNHELWLKGGPDSRPQRNGGATDSTEKLHKVMQLCRDLGVVTQPAQLGNLLLVPLLSWHHKSWDQEPDILGIPRASAMTISDYAACKWPDWMPGASELGSDSIAAWFDEANEDELQQPGWAMLQQHMLQRSSSSSSSHSAPGSSHASHQGTVTDVISFSHFLPHQALLPEKRFLTFPNLAKAVGSDFLWRRLQQLQPDLHVFGHSHFAWDCHVEGMRCLQAPLCYPAERQHRLRSIICNSETSPASQPFWQHRGQQQQQQQQQQHHLNSSSSSSSSSKGRRSQQPHPLHMGLQGTQLSWLPAKVYEATFTAELHPLHQQPAAPAAAAAAATAPVASVASCLLSHRGIAVLHSSQLQDHQQQQPTSQQQLHHSSSSTSTTTSTSSTSSTSSSGSFYLITSWQGSWCPSLGGMWSEYYKLNPRQPDNTELAPWVLKRYKRFKRLSQRLKGSSQLARVARVDS